jgi:ABC-2 type transport system ATP-binding protein
MTEQLAIEAAGLAKRYGETRVLNGLDLAIPRGTVYAMLGPNGAGKTTTVRLLTTLTQPDGGSARVAGHDVVAERSQVRRAISLTGQYAALDALQSGTENLQMMGRLVGLSSRSARRRAGELLVRFDLVDAGDRRVGTYSGGMRRRLDLAASLVRAPEVLFLDEPTTGLDPRSRQQMWDLVGELTAGGVTVLLTTQYLEEADRLADRIAVIDRGAIVAEGTAAELKATVAGQRLDLVLGDDAGYRALDARLGERAVTRDPMVRTLGVATDGSAADVRAQLQELDPSGELVSRFALHTASLDDVFMTLTDRLSADPEREAIHA